MVQRVAVALATGNTVVICPSPATPLSALLFAEVCKEAGLPAGVINVVTDGRECGGMHKLVLREEVDKVAYAGTTRVSLFCHSLSWFKIYSRTCLATTCMPFTGWVPVKGLTGDV